MSKKKKFKRVIRNALKGTSIVDMFSKEDMSIPVKTVTYHFNSYKALIYFYMQFIIKDYIWERYPRYIKCIFESRRIKDVWYFNLGDYVIRSRPSTDGEKPLVKGVFKQLQLKGNLIRKEILNGLIQKPSCQPSFQSFAENNIKHGTGITKSKELVQSKDGCKMPSKSFQESRRGSIKYCGRNAEGDKITTDSCKCSLRKVPGTGKQVKRLRKVKGGIITHEDRNIFN